MKKGSEGVERFDGLELFLYIIPILQIILVQSFFRPYLKYKNSFKLSVADTLIPILLVGIHVLSVRWLAFSLIPYYLFAVFLLGLGITLYFEKSRPHIPVGKVIAINLKVSFILGFILYYVIVVARTIQLIRG